MRRLVPSGESQGRRKRLTVTRHAPASSPCLIGQRAATLLAAAAADGNAEEVALRRRLIEAPVGHETGVERRSMGHPFPSDRLAAPRVSHVAFVPLKVMQFVKSRKHTEVLQLVRSMVEVNCDALRLENVDSETTANISQSKFCEYLENLRTGAHVVDAIEKLVQGNLLLEVVPKLGEVLRINFASTEGKHGFVIVVPGMFDSNLQHTTVRSNASELLHSLRVWQASTGAAQSTSGVLKVGIHRMCRPEYALYKDEKELQGGCPELFKKISQLLDELRPALTKLSEYLREHFPELVAKLEEAAKTPSGLLESINPLELFLCSWIVFDRTSTLHRDQKDHVASSVLYLQPRLTSKPERSICFPELGIVLSLPRGSLVMFSPWLAHVGVPMVNRLYIGGFTP
jgi:hypothetical protein